MRIVVALGLISPFGPIAMDIYLPALPQVARDLDMSASMTQLTISACMIGLGLGQLVIGVLSDRWGRVLPVRLGLAAFVAFSVVCAVAPNPAILIAARVAQGFAGAAGMVVAQAVIRDVATGVKAVRLMVIMGLISGVGPIIAPVIGGQLMRWTSWRGSFVAMAILGVLIAGYALPILPETLDRGLRHRGGIRKVLAGFGALGRDPNFVRHALILAASCVGLFSYVTMSSLVFQQELGLSAQQYSLVFASNAVGLVVVGRMLGMLAERLGTRRVLILAGGGGSAVAVALLVAAVSGSGMGTLWPLLWCTLAFGGGIGPIARALALTWQGERAGTGSAVLGLVTFVVGATAGPVVSLAGANVRTMSFAMVLGLVSVLVLVLRGGPERPVAQELPAPA